MSTYAEDKTKLSFSVNGGLSNPIGETGEQYWNQGFYLSGGVFYPVTSAVSVGGYLTYHRWTPDEEELTEATPRLWN